MKREMTSMAAGWDHIGATNPPRKLLCINEEVRTAIAGFMQAEEDRRKAELLMRHAQKLLSIGILAEGIAHDFSNILTIILGHAALAKISLSQDSPVYQDILTIEAAGKRAAALSKRIMNYAEEYASVAAPVDFSRMAGEVADIMDVLIGKHVTLETSLVLGLPPVMAIPAQLRQLVMNIVINASEAIEKEGGRINISTGVRSYAGNRSSGIWFDYGPAEGPCVYIEVADTGCGMDEETVSKIFDPFFSTKSDGRGLGLTAVLGIVQTHKGAINVDSIPSKGTTFTVLFPV